MPADVLTRAQRTRILAVATAAIVVLLGWLLVRSDLWQGPPKTYEAPWSGPSAPATAPEIGADGEHVSLSYWGGACDDHADVDVDETRERVTLTVVVTEGSPRDCSADALRRQVVAELASPVAGRRLVDGASAR